MKKFRKILVSTLALVLTLGMLSACGSKKQEVKKSEDGKTIIEKVSIGFVPSREPSEIVTATEPLKTLLKDQLVKSGFDVKNIDITVGTSFEAVGEGLNSGTLDVGFIPAGTYVLYRDGAEVLLTATRKGLSVDDNSAKVWNDNKPTKKTDNQVTSYRALIIAGPSEKGQELAKKVNSGEKLAWEDVKDLKWSVMNPTSPAGYIYPTLWLNDTFGKTIKDLGSNAIISDSYGSAFARLASGQVDVLCTYADARNDQEKKWTENYSRTASIWDETNVIGVTTPIYNDTVSVSKKSKTVTPEFKKALEKALIEIAKTEEGKKVISVYSHEGYQPAKDADYDNESKAQDIVKKLK
ncbi:MAG: PhnD/SsuA/transferrin family substrate-binding protein [Peptoniphilaceae bacterium]|uniref:phosphate/phosphite/phosphonate ABC transporter substrate-binding protein n=1 Tax=Parvimonas sp. TaxID=1944660 RepID=UPI002A762285|nr:PhnD/SsuA/transferrin family substrate-binding protein [Parvimonas sp.]MDD7765026.1 PhnD/SsuA/transferrin family substrate-binding protein [Peptoniphilaceae bacterium]MDY3050290.1 PhnD/SsuA/transferrin family substrate-binding protein [Parvimonas sp.]